MKKPSLRPVSAVVITAGLALTLGLAWVAATVNAHSNERLLGQQVQQAAATLSGTLPVVQTQLADAVQVAIDTDGDPAAFDRFAASGISTTGSFTAISLWRVSGGKAQQLAVEGSGLALVTQHRAATFFAGIHPGSTLVVTGIMPGKPPRLGFADMPVGDAAGFVVYREGSLPTDRRITIPSSSPFAGLRLALYLGPKPIDADLIEATGAAPIHGRSAQTSLPFGNTVITLVGASKVSLAGGLSDALPWIVLGAGAVLALASGATVEFAVRRRILAEALAHDNDRLYRQQRDIAGTLQHALLPQVPSVDGIEIAARYVAGVADIEIGGDWFDVIQLDADRCVFFVGDVSGRGLAAATTMASLRYATRAYAAQGDDISTVLTKLGMLLDIERDHHFATVLAGEVNLTDRRVTLASAGHFMPLLLTEGGAAYINGVSEPPVGVAPLPDFTTVTFVPAQGATLIAFTDGLIERRDEGIDAGLERLRQTVSGSAQSLEDLVDTVTAKLLTEGAADDTVILAIRWPAS
jgi:serine phosphatase RsbU (regulator of sigma subunit)